MIDFSQGFARTAASRLKKEYIIWLTTVDAAGFPQPRPVWFQFDGQSVLMFSRPQTAKVEHIRHTAAVALHINSDYRADEVTVVLGEARILGGRPAESRLEAYVEKYRRGMEHLGYTPETFLVDYRVPIEVLPNRVRGF